MAPGQRVVVTGAGGFLGTRLVSALRAACIEVLPLSRSDGFDLLEDPLPLDGVDHVFHLAAETGVPDAWERPADFHRVNAHGTVRVLDQCRRAGATVTYVGAYIYGVPQYLPIDERHPVDANNPYAFSKWMGEQACEWFARCYGLPVTAIRLFNVYGPGQSDRFLIPRIVNQLLDRAVESIELMDLAPRRDYLYVDDAIAALLASRTTAGYELFNVGSGRSYSVLDVIERAMTAAGVRKPVRDLGKARPNEIPDVVADHARLTAASGWRPCVSLEQGLGLMVRGGA
ncbi:NAD-dependent dehydratase [Lysobacter bugurensis]|uniref:NAD-dependent dehydratase n=2 Tax=Cognatilysobacter bugurensis TaxID=543356 RepID=A0A918T421_9GAMM|nr:NAD-dependent dehydratase [Lysobacter bugurensis]